MYFEQKDKINASLDEVYSLVKDNLPKVIPYMPNIERVEVQSFDDSNPDETKIVNRWFAKAEIPAAAKKFINEELFSWIDTAVWDNKNHVVNYSIKSFVGKDLYEAKGTNYFTSLSDTEMEMKITCDVTIHADRVPGVPKFLVKKVLPIVEEMMRKMLGPNLTSLGKGVKEYLSNN